MQNREPVVGLPGPGAPERDGVAVRQPGADPQPAGLAVQQMFNGQRTRLPVEPAIARDVMPLAVDH